ncbi:MAG TPA: TonB family protein [Vicinamibacterales bacterium]|nr:TonB family protein [Vicinamibacterales bacterium]
MKAPIVALTLLLASASVARADDSLASARELYASAAYEEALATLNRVRATGVSSTDALVVEEYRVFCLLALGRGPEAQQAIETLVMSAPLYRPATDMSPRVRTAFTDVRRRLLPTIVSQQYARAKTSFDNKDYSSASSGFTLVLSALNDPDLAQAASQPPLSDLRTLATGFQELSAKAATPPPAPAPPAAAPAPSPAPTPAIATVRPSAQPPQAPPVVYSGLDKNVVQPAVLRQELPAFSGRLAGVGVGALEIVISEEGLVESATMRSSVNPSYDKAAINATRNWRYRPAMIDGSPVKFRKVIQINIKPQG